MSELRGDSERLRRGGFPECAGRIVRAKGKGFSTGRENWLWKPCNPGFIKEFRGVSPAGQGAEHDSERHRNSDEL